MKKASGASWVGTVVAVAALAAVGIGGYNYLSSGCPLGIGCDSGAQTAAAGHTKSDGCCPLTEAAVVTTVASTDCCKNKSAEECCKAAGESCTPANCGDKTEACAEKAAECTGEKKAGCSEAKSECAGSKSECHEKPASPANPG